jgi:acetyl-CoA C-acetyltransferase
MKEVAVVGYCRTAIAKAPRGALNQTHGIPLAAHVLRHVVERTRIDPAEVEDVRTEPRGTSFLTAPRLTQLR